MSDPKIYFVENQTKIQNEMKKASNNGHVMGHSIGQETGNKFP